MPCGIVGINDSDLRILVICPAVCVSPGMLDAVGSMRADTRVCPCGDIVYRHLPSSITYSLSQHTAMPIKGGYGIRPYGVGTHEGYPYAPINKSIAQQCKPQLFSLHYSLFTPQRAMQTDILHLPSSIINPRLPCPTPSPVRVRAGSWRSLRRSPWRAGLGSGR